MFRSRFLAVVLRNILIIIISSFVLISSALLLATMFFRHMKGQYRYELRVFKFKKVCVIPLGKFVTVYFKAHQHNAGNTVVYVPFRAFVCNLYV